MNKWKNYLKKIGEDPLSSHLKTAFEKGLLGTITESNPVDFGSAIKAELI